MAFRFKGFHFHSRRKVLILHAPENAWYKDYVGKPVWVNRKSIHKNEKGERVYNLKYYGLENFEIRCRDTLWIPKYIRRNFRTVNYAIAR